MTDYSPQRRRRPAETKPPAPEGMAYGPFGRLYPAGADGKAIVPSKAPAADVLPDAAPPEAPQQAHDDAGQPQKRRRRGKLGGFSLKLQAPQREGETRRWVNDEGNRIANLRELGYEFVSETGIQTSSPGSRVSRLVGTKANGEPLHAFLMETPDELYAEGQAEKEAVARSVDEAITRGDGTLDGQMSQIPQDQRYGQGSIRPDR